MEYFENLVWLLDTTAVFYLPSNYKVAGFLLRFVIARTIVAIAGTKTDGGPAILAHSQKSYKKRLLVAFWKKMLTQCHVMYFVISTQRFRVDAATVSVLSW